MLFESILNRKVMAALWFFLNVSNLFSSNEELQLTLSSRFGMQWGLSRELTMPSYNTQTNNKYLSLLAWELKKIPTIGMSSGYDGIGNMGFKIAFDAAIPGIHTGNMHDFDWFFSDMDWSHWSKHDITLRWGFVSDLSVHWTIKKNRNLIIRPGIAYHLDSWSWTDKLLKNIYSFSSHSITDELPRPFDAAKGDEFRSDYNTVGGGNYVDYEVTFHALLATFQIQFKHNKLSTTLTTRMGPAIIHSLDNHKQRISSSTGEVGLLFHNLGFGLPWLDGALELGILVSENLSFTICGNITWMPETYADTRLYDGKGNHISYSRGSGGFDLLRGGISFMISWIQKLD